jgi:hypothetical protein
VELVKLVLMHFPGFRDTALYRGRLASTSAPRYWWPTSAERGRNEIRREEMR